ncbi:hypothetical protein L917_17272 [Phytophthora nicotianae]|uniref:Uncharacterized protein n=1 Tax=Phytophthora nicotianae TaxID=4792 RepID=W2KDC2_PHYNI|nr:hypothetical protein L917_17272 [Phytophthora nicotianae]
MGSQTREGNKKRYSAKLKKQYTSVKTQIMVEISTTIAEVVGKMDIALRELNNKPNLRFGSIHMIFVGDWLQQLPVAAHHCFKLVSEPQQPRENPKRSQDDDATIYFLL